MTTETLLVCGTALLLGALYHKGEENFGGIFVACIGVALLVTAEGQLV